jgi:hypothetical protein
MSIIHDNVDETNPHAHIIDLLPTLPGIEAQEEEKQRSSPLGVDETESEVS